MHVFGDHSIGADIELCVHDSVERPSTISIGKSDTTDQIERITDGKQHEDMHDVDTVDILNHHECLHFLWLQRIQSYQL